MRFQAGRIILPLTFCLAVSFSILLETVSQGGINIISKRINLSNQTNFLLKSLLPFCFMAYTLALGVQYTRSLRLPDSRLSAAGWIVTHVPRGSTILNFINGPALPRSVFRMVQWPMFESRTLVKILKSERPSVERLKKERVDWVIWNETLTGRMLNQINPLDREYLNTWVQFKKELENSSVATKTFEAATPFSPLIEIFEVKQQS
jgi:hypothetical protein